MRKICNLLQVGISGCLCNFYFSFHFLTVPQADSVIWSQQISTLFLVFLAKTRSRVLINASGKSSVSLQQAVHHRNHPKCKVPPHYFITMLILTSSSLWVFEKENISTKITSSLTSIFSLSSFCSCFLAPLTSLRYF